MYVHSLGPTTAGPTCSGDPDPIVGGAPGHLRGLLGRLASSLLIQLLAFAAAVGGTAMLFVAIVDGTDGLTLGTVGVVVSLLGMTAMVYLPDTDEGGRQ